MLSERKLAGRAFDMLYILYSILPETCISQRCLLTAVLAFEESANPRGAG